MRPLLIAGMLVLIASSVASAQELENPVSLESLLAPSLRVDLEVPSFESRTTIGARAGFIKARDADNGTWFGGIQLRMHLTEAFALEGSITYHQDEFSNGDARVSSYPVEVTALYFLFPTETLKPYLLGGIGWYYSKYRYSGLLTGTHDETTSTVGGHLGFGVDMLMSGGSSIDADVRYIFIDPNSGNLRGEKFDSIQFTIGVNFR